MSDDKQIRAADARQLLDTPLFIEAIGSVELAAIEALAAADLADDRALQRHAALLQGVRAVRDRLHSIERSGKIAARPVPDRA